MRIAMLVTAMAVSGVARAQVLELERDKCLNPNAIDDSAESREIAFDPHKVCGELMNPYGKRIVDFARPKFPSMIKVRVNFTPELTKSIDKL